MWQSHKRIKSNSGSGANPVRSCSFLFVFSAHLFMQHDKQQHPRAGCFSRLPAGPLVAQLSCHCCVTLLFSPITPAVAPRYSERAVLPNDMNGFVCFCLTGLQTGQRTVTPYWPHFQFSATTQLRRHSSNKSEHNRIEILNPCLISGSDTALFWISFLVLKMLICTGARGQSANPALWFTLRPFAEPTATPTPPRYPSAAAWALAKNRNLRAHRCCFLPVMAHPDFTSSSVSFCLCLSPSLSVS